MSQRLEPLLTPGLLVLILALALAQRLPRLGENTYAGSEGIRLAQLDLLSAGYQACQDVFCNQGPIALQVMHPTYQLFGQDLAAARSSVVIGSLAVLVGGFWIARLLWGRTAGLLATLVLLISPAFSLFSRRAQPELIALGLAVVGVAAAVRYHQRGGQLWLILASASYALSLLVKPVALPAIVPIAFLLQGRIGVRRQDIAIAGAVCAGLVALVVWLVGPARVWEQIIFRWQSRLVVGGDLENNWSKITGTLHNDQLGPFLLAAVGAAGLAIANRRVLLALGLWTVTSLALLLVHTPLREKHVVILLPPVALLAGYALYSSPRWLIEVWRRRTLALAPLALAGGVTVALYLLELPGLIVEPRLTTEAFDVLEGDAILAWYDDAVMALRATTPPGSFVITEQPYIPFLAHRLIPPQLVEVSATRVKAGQLRDEQVIAEAERFSPRAVLFWSNVLFKLPGFRRWVNERYQVVRVYAADRETTKTLYLPRADDPAPFRAALALGAPIQLEARFGGLRLRSWGLDSSVAEPGELHSLTAVWEAAEPLTAGLSATMSLHSTERAVWTSQRLPLLGSGDGVSTWTTGRWVVWSGLISVPQKLEPGSYALAVQVSVNGGGSLPLLESGNQARGVGEESQALSLTTIEVRAPGAAR